MDDLERYLDAKRTDMLAKAERQMDALRSQRVKLLKGKSPPTNPDASEQKLDLTIKRLREFRYLILGEVQCPQCFADSGRGVSLIAKYFVVDGMRYDCPICQHNLIIPRRLR